MGIGGTGGESNTLLRTLSRPPTGQAVLAAPATIVVGTAGHIDHGKTSLVKALTGIDTDRLPEEKARGITIDLGFAFLEEPDGLTIEIVDVPGHERFVKNMLAGVGGIDLALLVIAADEGVMPQTREHLAICQLLRIKAGMVALTKTDLVEPDWIELVKDDVTRLLADTFFAGCPIVPISVKTGQGLPELRRTPGALLPTLLVDASLELLADAPRPLKTRDRVRFHVGTQEVMARVLLVGPQVIEPGSVAYGRFRLEARVCALPGDRYVIRSYSPIVTIGGGTVLDISPPRFKRKGDALLEHLCLLERGTAAQVVEEHLRQAGAAGLRAADLRARTPFGPERLRVLLEELSRGQAITPVDREWYVHREASQRLREQTLSLLQAFHAQNPLRGGISRQALRSRAGHAQEKAFTQQVCTLAAKGLVR